MTWLPRMAVPACALPMALGGQADATMFRGGPDHLGVYTSATTPTLAVTVWRFKTHGKVYSSPMLYGGLVIIGSSDDTVYAVSAATGAVRWKVGTQGAVNSSPAAASGLVYFNSADGKLYAVDALTGKVRWTFATAGERRFTARGIHGLVPATETMPDPFDVFLLSPVIDHGVVYFGSGDSHVLSLIHI